MLGYSKNKFGCEIEDIADDIAYVTLCDKNDELSFMEIPIKDLEDNGIECKCGSLFRFILKQFCGWEKISFTRLPKLSMSLEEIEKLRKYYEEKYGDI